MKKLWLLTGLILAFFLLLFGIALATGIPIEETARRLVEKGGWAGMALSIALLISDVFLPVPSSIIMIVNGTIYGPWLGAAISLAGGTGATAVGYLLGRAGEKTVLKWISKEELNKAGTFYKNWGALAVIVSRPVPLLSETVAVMAGLSGWGWGKTVLSAVAGFLPVTVIYALSGYYVVQKDYGTLTFLLVIGIGVLTWLLGRAGRRKKSNP